MATPGPPHTATATAAARLRSPPPAFAAATLLPATFHPKKTAHSLHTSNPDPSPSPSVLPSSPSPSVLPSPSPSDASPSAPSSAAAAAPRPSTAPPPHPPRRPVPPPPPHRHPPPCPPQPRRRRHRCHFPHSCGRPQRRLLVREAPCPGCHYHQQLAALGTLACCSLRCSLARDNLEQPFPQPGTTQ